MLSLKSVLSHECLHVVRCQKSKQVSACVKISDRDQTCCLQLPLSQDLQTVCVAYVHIH